MNDGALDLANNNDGPYILVQQTNKNRTRPVGWLVGSTVVRGHVLVCVCVYGEMPTLLQHAEVGAVPTNNMVLDLVPSVSVVIHMGRFLVPSLFPACRYSYYYYSYNNVSTMGLAVANNRSFLTITCSKKDSAT